MREWTNILCNYVQEWNNVLCNYMQEWNNVLCNYIGTGPLYCVITVMRRLTTGIRSDKFVIGRFSRCANVIECT